MFFYLILFAIFLICVHILFNYNAKARAILKIPARKGHFIIGNALDILMVTPVELFKYGRGMVAEFSGIHGFHAFPMSSINIYNPEDIEIITSTLKHHEKAVTYKIFKPWLQEGLLLSKGAKWQARRKILTLAFHYKVLTKYYATMKDNDREFVEALKETKGESVDITSCLSEHTLNIICETAMGFKLREKSGAGKSYKEAIYSLGNLLMERFSNVYMHLNFIFNLTSKGKHQKRYLSTVHNFTRNLIEERKIAINVDKVGDINDNEDEFSSKTKRTAMLDLLISLQKEGLIDDVGIQEEVDTFTFEGHDTTATGLQYILLLLANHPEAQSKVVDEIKEIFGNDNREATMDDLASMKYLDLCIKESMRLYPPVPFIMRQTSHPCKLSNFNIPANTICCIFIYDLHRNEKIYEDPHKFIPERFLPENSVGRHNYAYIPFSAGPRNCIGNFNIPANTICCIFIYDLHRNEKIYEDPHKFIPERFLPENSVGRHNYAYIPFSAGPRNCIGQKFAMLEMKSIVTSILRHFELKPVTTEKELCLMADLVLRATKPIYVKFIERKQG